MNASDASGLANRGEVLLQILLALYNKSLNSDINVFECSSREGSHVTNAHGELHGEAAGGREGKGLEHVLTNVAAVGAATILLTVDRHHATLDANGMVVIRLEVRATTIRQKEKKRLQ